MFDIKNVSAENFKDISAQVRRLVRAGNYKITRHALEDHPERKITAADILECLKIGDAASLEPRNNGTEIKYTGSDRYRWFGQDTLDRVLRLIISISSNVIVISAAEVTENQEKRYLDQEKGESS